MEQPKSVSASATAATAKLAMEAAQKEAAALFKEKYPEEKRSVVAGGSSSNKDGTHTAIVRLMSVPDDPDSEWGKEYFNTLPLDEHKERLRAIIAPTLEQNGFSYFKDEALFRRRTDDQINTVSVICPRAPMFSIHFHLQLPSVAEFYKTFKSDPRRNADFPADREILPDLVLLPKAFPGGPPYPGMPYDPLAPEIVVAFEEWIMPWFDKRSSLPAVKDALEQSGHNAVKHETLLAIYFLLNDKDRLVEYLQFLLKQMESVKYPRESDFSPFYKALRARYPKFFPPLDQFRADGVK